MGSRRHLNKKNSRESNALPVSNPLQTRPFGKGIQARQAKLLKTDVQQTRPFGTPKQLSSPQPEMRDPQTQLKQAESFGYNAANIPTLASSRLTPIQAKLKNQYEQEANQVAPQVVNPINSPQTQPSVSGNTIQRWSLGELWDSFMNSGKETEPKSDAEPTSVTEPKSDTKSKSETKEQNRNIMTVTDANASIRTSPPELKSTKEKIPFKSQVEILETFKKGKKEYVLVQQALPADFIGPPMLWGWTIKSNLDKYDLTHATSFGDANKKGKEVTTRKSSNPGYDKDTQAKKSFISAKQTRTLDKNFGFIKKGASKLIPETWEVTGKVEDSIDVIVLAVQTQTVEITTKGKTKPKKQTFYQVMDYEGNEFWVASKHIQVLNSRIMDKELVVGSRLDNLKKEPEKYAKVLAALEKVYADQVNDLLSSREYTPDQQDLLQKAKEFLQSSDKPQAPKLEVSQRARENGEMKLNENLIERLDLFYKFLHHNNLISGKPQGGYGARSSKIAHKNATKWTLNAKSEALNTAAKRLQFARQLIEIEGTDNDGTVWATNAQVKRLKNAMTATEAETQDESISEVIDEMRSSITLKQAICAEGYPTGDPRRRPNIRRGGISNHCGGEAYDVTFPFVFNYYDPIVDAIAALFGLHRPVKDYSKSPEHWHYERIGVSLGERAASEEAMGEP